MTFSVSDAVPAVALEFAKRHLRSRTNEDDLLIGTYILSATQRAEHILGREIVKRVDERALAVTVDAVPAAIRSWVMLEVTDLYEKRSNSESGLGQGRRNYDHLLDAFRVF